MKYSASFQCLWTTLTQWIFRRTLCSDYLPPETSKLQRQIYMKRYFYQALRTDNSSCFLLYNFSPVCPETDSKILDRHSNETLTATFSWVGEHVRLLHQVLLFLERWHNSNLLKKKNNHGFINTLYILILSSKWKKFCYSTYQVLITKGK